MLLEEGCTVSPYVLVRQIGSGGNSEVWLARCEGTEVAIKFLRDFDVGAKADKRAARFQAEILRLEGLPALGVGDVIPILARGVLADGRPWYSMPVAEPLVPADDRVRWALQTMIVIANAVAKLHVEGVVHRDLKPANVLLLGGRVVLADFGLSRGPGDEHLT